MSISIVILDPRQSPTFLCYGPSRRYRRKKHATRFAFSRFLSDHLPFDTSCSRIHRVLVLAVAFPLAYVYFKVKIFLHFYLEWQSRKHRIVFQWRYNVNERASIIDSSTERWIKRSRIVRERLIFLSRRCSASLLDFCITTGSSAFVRNLHRTYNVGDEGTSGLFFEILGRFSILWSKLFVIAVLK